jgi:hypothetical protein
MVGNLDVIIRTQYRDDVASFKGITILVTKSFDIVFVPTYVLMNSIHTWRENDLVLQQSRNTDYNLFLK